MSNLFVSVLLLTCYNDDLNKCMEVKSPTIHMRADKIEEYRSFDVKICKKRTYPEDTVDPKFSRCTEWEGCVLKVKNEDNVTHEIVSGMHCPNLE